MISTFSQIRVQVTWGGPVRSSLWPCMSGAPGELAGRKIVALFDRGAARDFVDLFRLSQHFPKTELLARAAEIDPGFDRDVFADMINYLDRYSETDLALGDVDVTELRNFFRLWRSELKA